MNIKECEGCCSYVFSEDIDNITSYSICGMHSKDFDKIPTCPCVNCIVKMICNKPCDEYSTYFQMYGLAWSRFKKRNR